VGFGALGFSVEGALDVLEDVSEMSRERVCGFPWQPCCQACRLAVGEDIGLALGLMVSLVRMCD